MIRKTAIALILGVAGLGATTAAYGQYGDRGRDYDGWRGDQMPGGSWQQSCTNARIRGQTLRARCQDRGGNWRYTQLDLRNCRRGYVSNADGRLVCGESDWNNNGGGWGGGNGGNWGNGRLPGGSWGASCRDANMNGSVLYARCDNGNGGWYSSQIDMRQCYSNRARNNYGRLECD